MQNEKVAFIGVHVVTLFSDSSYSFQVIFIAFQYDKGYHGQHFCAFISCVCVRMIETNALFYFHLIIFRSFNNSFYSFTFCCAFKILKYILQSNKNPSRAYPATLWRHCNAANKNWPLDLYRAQSTRYTLYTQRRLVYVSTT